VAQPVGHLPVNQFPRPASDHPRSAQLSAPPSHVDVGRDHAEMLRHWIWRDFAIITLGVWLIASPFTLGYQDATMVWNDVASGLVIATLGTLTLWPRFDLVRWALCFTGIWLLFAPLVFWATDAGAYANDTLVGALVIAFSVLVPMMPSRAHHEVMMTPGPDIPPGWSYNPSDWFQRGPIIAMAFVGFFLSRYLAAYQLGHIPYPWDPGSAMGPDAFLTRTSRRHGRSRMPALARCHTCSKRSQASWAAGIDGGRCRGWC
jgi:hypothetical protein